MKRICHIVDDTSPGGVTRLLDYILTSNEMEKLGAHSVVAVKAGASLPPRLDADVIVSHVVLSWRNLPFFLALRSRYARVPLMHMEHSYSPAFFRDEVSAPRRFGAMLSVSLSLFDRVITISSAQRDWLKGIARLDDKDVVLVSPLVELKPFFDIPVSTGSIARIGAIGRLDRQKGFDILVRAFRAANLPNVSLHIFGDGPEREKLERLAVGESSIVFHGHTDCPADAMASVDAVAMPSRREPYGLVALEALAAGRPLLVSAADGLLDHAANGARLVSRLTSEDWSAALIELVAQQHADNSRSNRQRARAAQHRFVEGWAHLLH